MFRHGFIQIDGELVIAPKSVNHMSGDIILDSGQGVRLQFRPNGDTFLNDRLLGSDDLIFAGIREFVEEKLGRRNPLRLEETIIINAE
jgi:hypothetical protein